PELWYLLGVAALSAALWLPGLRAVTQPGARDARQALEARIARARERARAERSLYTLVFTPASGRVDAVRWVPRAHDGGARPEEVPALSAPLPDGARVEHTTLPGDALVISESGFPLSRGQIILRAADGTRERVVLGGG
ncbi:MAG TPA: hypothetical protein PK794_06660, partial [Armatimonadota bacterium]|nr:hypothetical protein [Armatimonadota bacterium]